MTHHDPAVEKYILERNKKGGQAMKKIVKEKFGNVHDYYSNLGKKGGWPKGKPRGKKKKETEE